MLMVSFCSRKKKKNKPPKLGGGGGVGGKLNIYLVVQNTYQTSD